MREPLGHEHVDIIVRCLPGNHDYDTSIALSTAISCFYSRDPRVSVDTSPHEYFFHQHGRVLISAHHGDKFKPAEMPGIVASMVPEMWGTTSHRYGCQGHRHHDFAGEKHGMEWEGLGRLCGGCWLHSGTHHEGDHGSSSAR